MEENNLNLNKNRVVNLVVLSETLKDIFISVFYPLECVGVERSLYLFSTLLSAWGWNGITKLGPALSKLSPPRPFVVLQISCSWLFALNTACQS